MTNRRIISIILCVFLCLGLIGCADSGSTPSTGSSSQTEPADTGKSTGNTIYLYGEVHSRHYIIALELQLWQTYYHEYGMRHLFIEAAYYSAQMMNMWMHAEDDTILDQLFDAWEGTQAASDVYRNFYKTIKETCPETVFHGTDVGHQYSTHGYWYRDYLQEQGLTETEEYRLTLEAIEQGRIYYEESDQPYVYRENTMVENFIREYDSLNGESIMGIYGSAHTDLFALNFSKECPCMGRQLKAYYGDIVVSEDLYPRALQEAKPLRTETLEINGKSYTAEYFGLLEISANNPEYLYMEFWRVVDAYEDFCNSFNTGTRLDQNKYPMLLQKDQAYAIRYTDIHGKTRMEYYICTGKYSKDELYTIEVTFDQ